MFKWLGSVGTRFRAAVTSVFSTMAHPQNVTGWSFLNRTLLNFADMVRPQSNSIVEACIGWAQRNYSEAPLIIEQWNEQRQDYDQFQRHEILDLLEHPNDFYEGDVLYDAIIADYMLDGNAYIIPLLSKSGRPLQLWWAPHSMIEPMNDANDDSKFITHYDYKPGFSTYKIPVDQVIHFRLGMDPMNPRKGLSPMKSLLREIFTDDEAANMTASLLSNMGVPGVIISPMSGSIPKAATDQIKKDFKEKFTGDKKGEVMVMEGQTKIEQFGFSPEQMQLRSLRGIPEERITARVGINSAVLGLGAGLATTKVGATLREYREEAFESFMIPMWKRFAKVLSHQLLPFFKDNNWRLMYDLSKVRVLQDDEQQLAKSYLEQLQGGGITRAEFKRRLGRVAQPEDEVYFIPTTVKVVPAGLSPEDQAAQLEPADVVEAAEAVVRR